MTKDKLIEKIENFLHDTEELETWYDLDLVEQCLNLLDESKEFLKNN